MIILWKFPNSPSWSLCRSYPSAIIYAARLSDEHHRLLNMVDGGIEEAVRPLIPHFHLRITFSIFSQIEQDVCIKKQLEAVGVEFVFRKRAVPLLAILPHSYGFHSSSVLLPIDGGSSALCVTAGSPTPPCLFPATSFLYLRACVLFLCLCLCLCVCVFVCLPPLPGFHHPHRHHQSHCHHHHYCHQNHQDFLQVQVVKDRVCRGT